MTGWVGVVSPALRASAAVTLAARLARGGRSRAGLTAPDRMVAPVTVVVPARDEARRLPGLLASLRSAPAVADVIVVDDESTDDTTATARRFGATVVQGSPLPSGWAGKVWALHQGLQRAETEWVVTLDADTRPHADLPAALVSRTIADGVDLATVAGSFETPTRGVEWLHPAMLTTLVYRYGRPEGATTRRRWANGQCMAARRADLVGWLESVKGEVVEDVALARVAATEGRSVEMWDGSDLLTVRMFDDLSETFRGWSRSLALPGVEPRWRQLFDLVFLATTTVVPLGRLLAGRADAVDAVLVALRLGTLVGTRRAYGQVSVAYWASPLADPVALVALAAGVTRGRRQQWRGRSYG